MRHLKQRADVAQQTNTSSSTSSFNPVSAHKIPKLFRSALTLVHSPSPPSSAASTTPGTDISKNKNVLSPSGAEIVNNFSDLLLEPPQDLNLRHLWDRMCDDDVSGRILKWNKRQITQELKKNKLKHAVGALRALEPILRRQVRIFLLLKFLCCMISSGFKVLLKHFLLSIVNFSFRFQFL